MIVNKWEQFYREYFLSEEDLIVFVDSCEKLELNDDTHRAKIMMHQGQRLLTIADAMADVEEGHEPLKLLFLLIAAENISKLSISTNEPGRSKYHVKRFFNEFCSEADKNDITNRFQICGVEASFDDLICMLYDIRCDVVHEGKYWGFDFATVKRPSVLTGANGAKVLRIQITYEQFRDIVARGIVLAVQQTIRLK